MEEAEKTDVSTDVREVRGELRLDGEQVRLHSRCAIVLGCDHILYSHKLRTQVNLSYHIRIDKLAVYVVFHGICSCK